MMTVPFLSVARLLKLPILTEWNYLINKYKVMEVENYEKKENQVYMFFTCFNMFLYSVNSEFYGEKHYHSNTIFIIRHFIFAFIYYEFEKK